MRIKLIDWAYYTPRVYYKDPVDYEWLIQFRDTQHTNSTIRLAI